MVWPTLGSRKAKEQNRSPCYTVYERGPVWFTPPLAALTFTWGRDYFAFLLAF